METLQAAPFPEAPTLKRPRPPKMKRGYSRAFRPKGDGRRYLVDAIPAGLWTDVRRKAKRQGISLRALILTLLEQWANKPDGGGPV